MKAICRLCGKDCASIEGHLTFCLKKNSITREKYNDLPEWKVDSSSTSPPVLSTDVMATDSFDEIEQPQEQPEIKGQVTYQERIDNVFKDSVEKKDPNRPFSEALEEYKITEKEFVTILKAWRDGGKIPVDMQMKQKADKGKSEAKMLSDKDSVTTNSLETAESLVKSYGFEVITVKSAKGNTPKTWVLRKKK